MTLIELILFLASVIEFLVIILLLALLRKRKKRIEVETTIESEKEKKDYERVKKILDGIHSQKIKKEIESIPQIQKNLRKIDKIAKSKKIK